MVGEISLAQFAAIAAGVVAAMLMSWFLLRKGSAPAPRPPERDGAPCPSLSAVFRAGRLIDADDALWSELPDETGACPGWSDLQAALSPLAPDFPADPPGGAWRRETRCGIAIDIETQADTTRVALSAPGRSIGQTLSQALGAARLSRIAPAADAAPNPAWLVSEDGGIAWCNEAFCQLANGFADMPTLARQFREKIAEDREEATTRIGLHPDDGRTVRWFEVTTSPAPRGTYFFATAIDSVIRAEEAQRNFVQTLSKTFAHLTIGLAVFDRDRRLALFNPALIDLSQLSADLLSNRPNLFLFFDKLRENRIMPEPKNYGDWRERMARLVAAASDDRFCETWNLASGLTYRVTGRPHPDGAIAFLFEDISAEISLTRRFRSEIELTQSALDAMEEAVAVFNQPGVLTLCNRAFRKMWHVDPEEEIDDYTIHDATRRWREAFRPSPIWSELRDFVTHPQERASWEHGLTRPDGGDVLCRVDPLVYSATMVRFLPCQPARAPGSREEQDHGFAVTA